jgi:hypothetical protein
LRNKDESKINLRNFLQEEGKTLSRGKGASELSGSPAFTYKTVKRLVNNSGNYISI